MNLKSFTSPLHRFVTILYYSARRYGADHHSQRAVALTYYTIFAIVPVMALLFGIAKGFSLESRLRDVLHDRLWQHQELLEWIGRFAATTLQEARGGVVAGVGVIALIWTVMWLAGNVERAFNAVWKLPSRRNIFRRFSDYLAIILLTPVVLVVMSSAGVFIRGLLNRLAAGLPYFSTVADTAIGLAAGVLPLLISCLIFTLIYFMVPNTRVRFAPALLAGFVAGLLYQGFQDGFIYLQGSIYRYNRIYGSFAALPLFLIWLQWSWQIVLFGAEVGFVAQNLDYGLFSRAAAGDPSLRQRRLCQLTLARIIYQRLQTGGGAAARKDLADVVKIPPVQLDRELEALTAAGVIAPVEGSGDKSYLPARPAGFTLADCRRALDTNGKTGTSTTAAGAFPEVAAALDGFDQVAAASRFNAPLAEPAVSGSSAAGGTDNKGTQA